MNMTLDEHINHCQTILDEEPGNFEIWGMLADLYEEKGDSINANGCRWLIQYKKHPTYWLSAIDDKKRWFFRGIYKHSLDFLCFPYGIPIFLLDGTATYHVHRELLETIVFRNLVRKRKEVNDFLLSINLVAST